MNYEIILLLYCSKNSYIVKYTRDFRVDSPTRLKLSHSIIVITFRLRSCCDIIPNYSFS